MVSLFSVLRLDHIWFMFGPGGNWLHSCLTIPCMDAVHIALPHGMRLLRHARGRTSSSRESRHPTFLHLHLNVHPSTRLFCFCGRKLRSFTSSLFGSGNGHVPNSTDDTVTSWCHITRMYCVVQIGIGYPRNAETKGPHRVRHNGRCPSTK